MSRKFKLKKDFDDGIFHLDMPDKCIYCGEAKHEELDLVLKARKYAGEIKEYKVEIINNGRKRTNRLFVPYCSKHASRNKLFNRVYYWASRGVPALALLLVIVFRGIGSFLNFGTLLLSITMLLLISMIAEVAARVLLFPIFPSVRHMPFSRRMLFAKSWGGWLLGITVFLDEQADQLLHINICNNKMSEEIQEINKLD